MKLDELISDQITKLKQTNNEKYGTTMQERLNKDPNIKFILRKVVEEDETDSYGKTRKVTKQYHQNVTDLFKENNVDQLQEKFNQLNKSIMRIGASNFKSIA